MRKFHPYIKKMIRETALAYANSGIDSYLHIDNYMSINRRKFKPNARFIFAESILLNEDAANTQQQRQGVERTWGQAFQDFMGGGFSGLTKGKADIERNYKLAIQNLEQMLNLLDQYPSSTTAEVLDTLKQSIEKSVQELQSKQELIKNTSDRMKSLAMDKSRGEASRDFKIKSMNDLAQIPLDKLDIYTVIMNSPELYYYFSKQKVYTFDDIKNSIKEDADKTKYQTFYNNYINAFYNPGKDAFKTKNIPPDIINTYIFLSDRLGQITGDTTKNKINNAQDLAYFLDSLYKKLQPYNDQKNKFNIGLYENKISYRYIIDYLKYTVSINNLNYLKPFFEHIISYVNNNEENSLKKIIILVYSDAYNRLKKYIQTNATNFQDDVVNIFKNNSFQQAFQTPNIDKIVELTKDLIFETDLNKMNFGSIEGIEKT